MRKLAALLFLALPAFAQPHITHATVTTVAGAGDLGRQVRASATPWIGYAVPAVDGYRVSCQWCSLSNDNLSFDRNDDNDLHPAAGNIAIFYRVANGAVEKVRVYSVECALEGGGASITWIDGVAPRGSIALLASLIGGEKSIGRRAMSALAMHGDPSAGDRLEEWARSSAASDDVRREAAFWLGQKHDPRALDALEEILRK